MNRATESSCRKCSIRRQYPKLAVLFFRARGARVRSRFTRDFVGGMEAPVDESEKVIFESGSRIWLLAKSPRMCINRRGDNSSAVSAGMPRSDKTLPYGRTDKHLQRTKQNRRYPCAGNIPS